MNRLAKINVSVLIVCACSASHANDMVAAYECEGKELKVHFHDDWAEAHWLGSAYELHKAVSVDDVVYLGEELSIREDATHLELDIMNKKQIHCVRITS
ncbi:hypothetical protein [Marinomonas balearica]|uniref:Membrane-bound lysozyme inhibitor of c-type lysozyme MliC n=1 Tax=Marinomonas balearica TaxID=491947 RepID=A0A4R6MD25_9GAMM|nr:hypothetical protein [Marinomonas balearica]TDO99414.1 hypothetical protein DFP79_0396 [Marinomonas balearica]